MPYTSEPPEQVLAKGRRYALVEITDHYTLWEDVRYPHLPDVYYHNGTGNPLVAWGEIDVDQRWQEWKRRVDVPPFFDWLRSLTWESDCVDDLRFCAACQDPTPEDDMLSTNIGAVCEECSEDYHTCGGCNISFHVDNVTWVGDDDTIRCRTCLEADWTFCEPCDAYFLDESGHSHEDEEDDGCCEAPGQRFTIRNDGLPALANDTRVTVSLGAGEISDVGIEAIREAIRNWARVNITGLARYTSPAGHTYSPEYMAYWDLANDLSPLGVQWQQKDGNWTKRFSRHAYKSKGLKIAPDLVSTIGNIASDHSKGADHHLEVTRDLNQSARAFAHSDSCWWQSYSEGRCALKSNGGFGLRTFDEAGDVAGRAWVLPLRGLDGSTGERRLKRDGSPDCLADCCWETTTAGSITPTFDTMGAQGFVVFNGYKNLGGYAPARILAHMVGMTYRKIEFTCGPMYVNNNAGYLVAPEEVAQRYTDGAINITVDQHSDLFAREQQVANHITTETRETVNA